MSAQTIAADIAKGVTVVGAVANDIDDVLPWLMLAAGFIPGADTVLAALQIASPIIRKIAAAAPLAADAINAGIPVAVAIDKASPSILADLKDMLAIFMTHKSGMTISAADITDAQAYAYAGPVIMGRQWTDAEMQTFWDKADGTVRDAVGSNVDGF